MEQLPVSSFSLHASDLGSNSRLETQFPLRRPLPWPAILAAHEIEIASLPASIVTLRPCLSRARSLDHVTAGLHYCRQSLFSKEFRFVPKAWFTPACLRSQFIVIPHPPSCVFATTVYQRPQPTSPVGAGRLLGLPAPPALPSVVLGTALAHPPIVLAVCRHYYQHPPHSPSCWVLCNFTFNHARRQKQQGVSWESLLARYWAIDYCPHFQLFLSYLTLPALPTTVPSTRDQAQASVTSIYFWLTTA